MTQIANELMNKLDCFVHKNKCFEKVSNEQYKCTLCDFVLKYSPEQGIKLLSSHLTTKRHIKNVSLILDTTRNDEPKNDKFHTHLIKMMIECNILLLNVYKKVFKSFFEKIITIEKNLYEQDSSGYV
jgi:hypothetical protein